MGNEACVLVPTYRSKSHSRDWDSRLTEAVSLTRSIGLKIVYKSLVPLPRLTPSTLLGKGKVSSLRDLISSKHIGIAIVDHPLTPVQQRNLERAWQVKVIDRTGLILEIFGARAQTKEGILQVDWAHLMYQRGRLVRSWTHLERQRGGAGTVGGPGETQIESDRRQIDQKIKKIEKAIEKVKKTRSLQRQSRQKIPYPVVALVGYTNGGKSTLFNRLTGSGVLAKDMLFATLDPKLGRLPLSQNSWALLSDTVGFISDLPTHLVAAFRATLEEVVEADLILHIRDISNSDTTAQSKDVYDILHQLGIEKDRTRILEVWNKVDLCTSEHRQILNESNGIEPIIISALDGEGVDNLVSEIKHRLSQD